MSKFEAAFTFASSSQCIICKKRIYPIKRRVRHVLDHVSTDTDHKIYSCKLCEYSASGLSKIAAHVKNHIDGKAKKSDPKEIMKHFEDEMKKNEKVISVMGEDCFGSPIHITRIQANERPNTRGRQYAVEDENENEENEDEQDDENALVRVIPDAVPMKEEAGIVPTLPTPVTETVPMEEDDENIKPPRIPLIEPTSERKWLRPTMKQEDYVEKSVEKSKQNQTPIVLERIEKIEDSNDSDDDVEIIFEKQWNENRGLVLAPLIVPATSEVLKNYRLQKEWDTDELIVNMRAVGRMLKFSKNVIDLAMNVLKEHAMDGASMSYQAENLTEFFELCPVVIGVRTAITKILQTMGQKEFNG